MTFLRPSTQLTSRLFTEILFPLIWLYFPCFKFCIICITRFPYFFTILIDNNTALLSLFSRDSLLSPPQHCLKPGPISGPRCLLFVSGSESLCCIIWTTLWFPLTASRHPSLECYKRYKNVTHPRHGPETRSAHRIRIYIINRWDIKFHNHPKRGENRTFQGPPGIKLKFEKKVMSYKYLMWLALAPSPFIEF